MLYLHIVKQPQLYLCFFLATVAELYKTPLFRIVLERPKLTGNLEKRCCSGAPQHADEKLVMAIMYTVLEPLFVKNISKPYRHWAEVYGVGKTCQIWSDISTCLRDVTWGCDNSGPLAQLALELVALQLTGASPGHTAPNTTDMDKQQATGEFKDRGHRMEDLRDDKTGGPNRK